jgi:hypothetical protein
MQPLPETTAALNEYMGWSDTAERTRLMRLGREAQQVVPELVGLSLTIVEDDITFTLADADTTHSVGRPVASSLTMPVLDHGRAVAGVDLYASAPHAFDGHHEELARAFGASSSGIVADADLPFASRLRALEAPGRLQDQNDVEVSMGHLAATHGLDLEDARTLIRHVAARAGVTPGQAARVLRHYGFAL